MYTPLRIVLSVHFGDNAIVANEQMGGGGWQNIDKEGELVFRPVQELF